MDEVFNIPTVFAYSSTVIILSAYSVYFFVSFFVEGCSLLSFALNYNIRLNFASRLFFFFVQ